MTANEEWFDISVQHQIDLGRVQTSHIQDSIALLNNSERDLKSTLEKRLAVITDRGFDTGPATTARMNRMLDQVTQIRSQAYKDLDRLLTGQVEDLAEFELEFTDNALSRVLPVQIDFDLPTPERLSKVVKTTPFQGRILKEWTRGMEKGDIDRLTSTIRQGVVEGLTTQAIVTSVIGTRKLGFKDGILQKSRQSVTAMTRTALNHTANVAREEFFKENEDIVKHLVWVSVLDGRTTPICQARSGLKFPVGKGPRPPAHIACRSLMVATLDGIGLVGEQATIRDTRTRRVREIDFRRDAKLKAGVKEWSTLTEKQRRVLIGKERAIWADSAIGQTPATTTYSQWLKRQPVKFQNEVLGKARAEAFRSGEVTLDKFVDLRTGKRFTLDDLRIKATSEKLFSASPGSAVDGLFDIKYLEEQTGLKGTVIRRKLRSLGITKTGKTYDFGTKEEADRILALIKGGKGRVKPAPPAIPGITPTPTTPPLPLTTEQLRKKDISTGFTQNFRNSLDSSVKGVKRKRLNQWADTFERSVFNLESTYSFKTDPRLFKRPPGGEGLIGIRANSRGLGRNTSANYSPNNRVINMGTAGADSYGTFVHESHHWLDFTTLSRSEVSATYNGRFVTWSNRAENFVDPIKMIGAKEVLIADMRRQQKAVLEKLFSQQSFSPRPGVDRLKNKFGQSLADDVVDANFDIQEDWGSLYGVSEQVVPRVSNYALHSIVEYMAESGALFHTNPEKLRSVAPKTFEVFINWYRGDYFK